MAELPEPAQFDAEYLRRLKEGDPETQSHFSDYFGFLLQVKLAKGVRSWQMLLDVRQETLLRVLEAVRAGDIKQPASLGAFVCSTSNHVLWEYRRLDDRGLRELDPGAPEPIDERMEIERDVIDQDRKRVVESVLRQLSATDSRVLRLLLLEDRDKDEVCRELDVTPDYLRVVLHRAKARFRNRIGLRRRKATSV
ncbi:MAG: RNA polymerase sigma factor [Bryobacteraceae bacterium]